MNAEVVRGVDEVIADSGLDVILPLLGPYVAAQRWSGGRGSDVVAVEFVDAVTLSAADPLIVFTLVEVRFADGRTVRYALPIGVRPVGDPLAERAPSFVIGEASLHGRPVFVYDALGDPDYIHWIWDSIRTGRSTRTAGAVLSFDPTDGEYLANGDPPEVRWLTAEQSNTSVVLNDETFLKHLRRVEAGPSHELEMAGALRSVGFANLARTDGVGLYAPPDESPSLLVLLQEYLRNGTEGWALALTSLRDLYAEAEEDHVRDALERQVAVDEQGGNFAAEAARLGAVTGEMHVALASPELGPAMEPVPLTRADLGAWADAMTAELDRLLAVDSELLLPLREERAGIVQHFDALRGLEPGGMRTRVHGDLHLGQMLRTDSGWVILDFEGEPNRRSAERRARTSPLRDVAGMLRSLDYAAAAALAERAHAGSSEWRELVAQGDAWAAANRDAFWAAYLAAVDRTELLPSPGSALLLRRAFEVQKAIYEVDYELGHRPSWAAIPVRFLLLGAR